MTKIEKLSLENLDQFLLIFKEVLKTGFPEYSEDLVNFLIEKDYAKNVFEEKLKSNQWFGFLEFIEEKPAAFLLADSLFGGVSYCNWLGVGESYRGRGLARDLLNRWEEEVEKAGGHKLTLITQGRKNHDFYLKMGFKQEGFEEKSWFGLDCWIYGKVIGEPRPNLFLR